MIYIPTGELVGVLNDVIPFACDDDELPTLNCVRLEWDGTMFHAMATDRHQLGWASWHPDDQPDSDGQDDAFTTWGGVDEPWQIVLTLADVEELVKNFKLPVKRHRVPLTLDADFDRLTVRRARDTGHSDMRVTWQAAPVDIVDVPDVRDALKDNSTLRPVTGLAVAAHRLAAFGKVRTRGPVEMSFTGADGLILVRIGNRFEGGVMPTRVGDGPVPA